MSYRPAWYTPASSQAQYQYDTPVTQQSYKDSLIAQHVAFAQAEYYRLYFNTLLNSELRTSIRVICRERGSVAP